ARRFRGAVDDSAHDTPGQAPVFDLQLVREHRIDAEALAQPGSEEAESARDEQRADTQLAAALHQDLRARRELHSFGADPLERALLESGEQRDAAPQRFGVIDL